MKNLLSVSFLFISLIFATSCSDNTLVDGLGENFENKKEEIVIKQIIFSVDDFVSYSKQKDLVISKLSKDVLEDFTNNLVYGENGELATAKYSEIEKELSQKDIEIFWSYFGYKYEELTDYKDYKCTSPHNCFQIDKYICMSGC